MSIFPLLISCVFYHLSFTWFCLLYLFSGFCIFLIIGIFKASVTIWYELVDVTPSYFRCYLFPCCKVCYVNVNTQCKFSLGVEQILWYIYVIGCFEFQILQLSLLRLFSGICVNELMVCSTQSMCYVFVNYLDVWRCGFELVFLFHCCNLHWYLFLNDCKVRWSLHWFLAYFTRLYGSAVEWKLSTSPKWQQQNGHWCHFHVIQQVHFLNRYIYVHFGIVWRNIWLNHIEWSITDGNN